MQIQLQCHGLESSEELTEFIERTLRSSLKRHDSRLRSAVVSLHDLNGPRGGVDQECRITVRTIHGHSIVITERDSSMRAAVGRAADRAQEAVRRRTGFRLRFVGRKTQEPGSTSGEFTR